MTGDRFEKESGVYRGLPKEMQDYSMKLFEQCGHAATGNYVSDDVPVFFDMEIMIRAQRPAQAQQAMNLLHLVHEQDLASGRL